MCALLQAADVWFGYGARAASLDEAVIRGVTLTIPADGFVGILGPNGAGKTTLLRLLAGTRQPQRGSIALDGVPLSRLSRIALARRMAVVPQETHLAFDYTVLEVATMGRYPHLGAFEVESPSDLAIVEDALASTGTLDLKDRPFDSLSGGEKQRVIIAAALAQLHAEPAVAAKRLRRGLAVARVSNTAGGGGHLEHPGGGHLLLDEPTASLDLAYQLEVATLLKALHQTRGVAIVVSTHDLNLAASLCTTVVLMRGGEIIASGATRDVITADNIRRLYGVDADVIDRPSGHRVIVPLGRVSPGARS